MPDCFTESSEGVVLAANGINKMLRWDGFADQFTEAGVRQPTTAPTLSGIGPGAAAPIVGTYRAYLRFVDKYGNFSDLSPLSNEATVNGRIQYGSVQAATQETVARRQILRNTDGQFTTVYVDIDTTDLVSATLVSDTPDAVLVNNTAVPLLDANGNNLANLYAQPPDTKPFLASHLGRIWAAGEQPYTEGCVWVTNGSNAVYGVGTSFSPTFVGRLLYVTGADRAYEITAVDTPTQGLVLETAYTGQTDQFAAYSVRPAPAESSLVYFSEAGAPESWPVVNALSLPEDNDVVTGMFTFRSFLYVVKRHHVYQISAQSEPKTDGFVFPGASRGCVNNRCWVIVDEFCYMLDEGGVYRYSGGQQVEPISTPIQNLFRKKDDGTINWSAQRYFHAVYDPSAEVVKWFVAIRGEYLPRHAIAFAVKQDRWWVEEYPVPIGASANGSVGRPTGGWAEDTGVAVFLGGPASEVYTVGGPSLDGVDPDAPFLSGSVSSAGMDTLTDISAAFDTSVSNVPVCISAGRGAGQIRVVVIATATTLKVNEPWSVTPDATSRYQIGGFRYKYLSQRLRYSFSEQQTGRSMELVHRPTATDMEMRLALIHDFAAEAVPIGRRLDRSKKPGTRATTTTDRYLLDLSYPPGTRLIRFDGHREQQQDATKFLCVQFEGESGPDRVEIGDVVFNGIAR